MSSKASYFYDAQTNVHLYRDTRDGHYVYIEDALGNLVAIRIDKWNDMVQAASHLNVYDEASLIGSKPESPYYHDWMADHRQWKGQYPSYKGVYALRCPSCQMYMSAPTRELRGQHLKKPVTCCIYTGCDDFGTYYWAPEVKLKKAAIKPRLK